MKFLQITKAVGLSPLPSGLHSLLQDLKTT